MLVDEEEFCTDSPDTTYGYAPKSFRKGHHQSEEQGEGDNLDVSLSEENCNTLCEEPAGTSFLRTGLNPASQNSFAGQTVIRAGCSTEALTLTEQLKTSPSGVQELPTKLSEEDGALLATQLNKELTEEWCSTSLFSGLGTDHAGLIVGGSLLQTYDLLCNINLHLIVIQRELLKHKDRIRKLCSKDEVSARSFADGENKKQLLRLLRSLDVASASLRDRVASLNCAVVGLSFKPTNNNSLISNFTYLACGIGIFLGLLLCRRQLD